MKKIILWCLGFLLLVALIPLASGIKGLEIQKDPENIATKATESNDKSVNTLIKTNTPKLNSELSEKEIEIIVSKVMEHITEDANTETKKAILAVCKNNYLYMKGKGETEFQTEVSKYSDDFLKELIRIYNESDYIITYKNERVAIPMVPQNGGFTSTNDEYPYIQAVASPWDTFSKSYIRGAQYPCGVSIYGIDYLCNDGLSWNEALSWYLPNFTIEN